MVKRKQGKGRTAKVPRAFRGLKNGTHVVWPQGLELQLGIGPVTRWRWERDGKLPARDVSIGGRSGWRPETIAAAIGGAA